VIAVLSCIQGNLEALDAVLADIAEHPVTGIYCLGDVVGYGPNPVECLERAMNWDVTLVGNHDQATLFDPDGFSVNLERSIFWGRAQLDAAKREDLWDFLAGRPKTHTECDFLFVHGSPRNPVNEYVFPEDVYNERKMTKIGSLIERYCLCGHTHVPGVFIEKVGEPWSYSEPRDTSGFWRLDGRKTIVNVGSVGQPRDGDWRACYVLLDGWDVTFRRVEYDWQKTRDKIYAIPELENFLGDRLGEGR
jgi:diadenosine tetraphosphatase ApaH/serine/threonine PP2A family protein phosphatase